MGKGYKTMTDFLGKELNIGDRVITVDGKRSLLEGTIISMTEKTARVRYEWSYDNRVIASEVVRYSEKIYKI